MLAYGVANADFLPYGTDLPPQQTTVAPTFSDVPPNYWAYQSIMEMAKLGMIKGYPDGGFYPDNMVTRAEFAKLLSSAIDVKPQRTASAFVDVPNDYWAAPFIAPVNQYITTYVDNNGRRYFKPDFPVTREDVAAAMAKAKGLDAGFPDDSILTTMFTDNASISPGLRNYVALAVENKLISGYPDHTFHAQDALTRAEVAVLLNRARQLGFFNKTVGMNPVTAPTTPVTGQPTQTTTPAQQPTQTKRLIASNLIG